MSLSNRLTATQLGPGAPLVISAVVVASDPEIASWSDQGVGVTTTSDPPATKADFVHYDGSLTLFDLVRSQGATAQAPGGTVQTNVATWTFGTTKRLDSNYVAGRYVWFATWDVTPPISSSVPQSLSSPRLIE